MIVPTSFPTIVRETRTSETTKTIKMSTGNDLIIINRISKESDNYILFYNDGIKAITFLTPIGIKILQYIFLHLDFNSNVIELRQNKMSEELGINAVSINRGIKNLCTYHFIEKIDIPFSYGINHNYFFKGNRSNFLKDCENVRKETESSND